MFWEQLPPVIQTALGTRPTRIVVTTFIYFAIHQAAPVSSCFGFDIVSGTILSECSLHICIVQILKLKCLLPHFLFLLLLLTSQPRCSRDPRFAGSNPAEVDGFFQDVIILSTSPPGGTLSWGPESEISGSLKNLKPEKICLWAKFNRHIHVLVTPKFRGAQLILERSQCIGRNDHPIKTDTNTIIIIYYCYYYCYYY